METTATQIETITTTTPTIESKTNLPYNFFISKHEDKGRSIGLQIADTLADLGFTYWISQHQDNADEDSIQQGIRDSEAIILVLTPGIFAPERRYVTNTEIKFAIELQKCIILVDAGFRWDKLSPCMHLVECCENVAPEFQPYARALISALQVHRWHVDVRYRNVDTEILIARYNARDKEAAKLCNYVAREVVKGECIHSKHHFDATTKSIKWTDRQHVMCEGFLSVLVAVFLVISVVTYFQRSTEQIKQVAFINGTTIQITSDSTTPDQCWRKMKTSCGQTLTESGSEGTGVAWFVDRYVTVKNSATCDARIGVYKIHCRVTAADGVETHWGQKPTPPWTKNVNFNGDQLLDQLLDAAPASDSARCPHNYATLTEAKIACRCHADCTMVTKHNGLAPCSLKKYELRKGGLEAWSGIETWTMGT
jgi:hypothetical protein